MGKRNEARELRREDISEKAEKRFWEKVKVGAADECWEWQFGLDRIGYGQFCMFNQPWKAHRISWVLANSVALTGADRVLHTCDNPPCVNPIHLWLGTDIENIKDKVAKGRQARGDRQHLVVLQAKDIPLIRQKRKEGLTLRAIGTMFGCDGGTIGYIVRGKTWKHVA